MTKQLISLLLLQLALQRPAIAADDHVKKTGADSPEVKTGRTAGEAEPKEESAQDAQSRRTGTFEKAAKDSTYKSDLNDALLKGEGDKKFSEDDLKEYGKLVKGGKPEDLAKFLFGENPKPEQLAQAATMIARSQLKDSPEKLKQALADSRNPAQQKAAQELVAQLKKDYPNIGQALGRHTDGNADNALVSVASIKLNADRAAALPKGSKEALDAERAVNKSLTSLMGSTHNRNGFLDGLNGVALGEDEKAVKPYLNLAGRKLQIAMGGSTPQSQLALANAKNELKDKASRAFLFASEETEVEKKRIQSYQRELKGLYANGTPSAEKIAEFKKKYGATDEWLLYGAANGATENDLLGLRLAGKSDGKRISVGAGGKLVTGTAEEVAEHLQDLLEEEAKDKEGSKKAGIETAAKVEEKIHAKILAEIPEMGMGGDITKSEYYQDLRKNHVVDLGKPQSDKPSTTPTKPGDKTEPPKAVAAGDKSSSPASAPVTAASAGAGEKPTAPAGKQSAAVAATQPANGDKTPKPQKIVIKVKVKDNNNTVTLPPLN